MASEILKDNLKEQQSLLDSIIASNSVP